LDKKKRMSGLTFVGNNNLLKRLVTQMIEETYPEITNTFAETLYLETLKIYLEVIQEEIQEQEKMNISPMEF